MSARGGGLPGGRRAQVAAGSGRRRVVLRSPRALGDAAPLGVGWNSVVHAHDFSRIKLNLRPDASRYEGGSRTWWATWRLGAASICWPAWDSARTVLRSPNACGAHRRGGGAAGIDRCRRQELPPAPAAVWHSDVRTPGRNPVEVRRRCLQAGVVLSVRGGNLRISPHAYNDETDLDRLIDVLRGTGVRKAESRGATGSASAA